MEEEKKPLNFIEQIIEEDLATIDIREDRDTCDSKANPDEDIPRK